MRHACRSVRLAAMTDINIDPQPPLPGVPTMMLAAAIDRFGPPDVLSLHTLPVPAIDANEVLIAVYVAGVGSWDAKIRDGSWASGDEKFPLVLGADGAGYIVAVGADVRFLAPGDRVYAYEYANPKGGFYAEYVAVDAENAAIVPRTPGRPEAGVLPCTGLTALQGIDDVLQVRKDDTVLVFGATGGVGSLAVQFAKRHDAHVIGTATGPEATAFVQKLGAEAVIDARAPDAVERLRATAPKGLDAVLALAGGDNLERLLDLVRDGGRVAYPDGVEPEPRPRGAFRVVAYDGVVGPREFERLEHAVIEAALQVPLAGTVSLGDAADAHRLLEGGRVFGRLGLRVRELGDEPEE
jgi:NADPH:quinone reductase-like Zn-dependent oxidoreductase